MILSFLAMAIGFAALSYYVYVIGRDLVYIWKIKREIKQLDHKIKFTHDRALIIEAEVIVFREFMRIEAERRGL